MFYSESDGYMQDLYFYNQNPNQNFNNQCNSYMNMGIQNPNMVNNQNGMYMGMPQNNFGTNQSQNISNFYPSTYKIIAPVASRVISNTNCQFINEDILNNMVDTVYNIVDGQIEYEDVSNINNKTEVSTQSSNSQGTTVNNSRTSDTKQSAQNTVSSKIKIHDSLLRDIIRIIIIKELLSRNRFNQNNYQNLMPNSNYSGMQIYNW